MFVSDLNLKLILLSIVIVIAICSALTYCASKIITKTNFELIDLMKWLDDRKPISPEDAKHLTDDDYEKEVDEDSVIYITVYSNSRQAGKTYVVTQIAKALTDIGFNDVTLKTSGFIRTIDLSDLSPEKFKGDMKIVVEDDIYDESNVRPKNTGIITAPNCNPVPTKMSDVYKSEVWTVTPFPTASSADTTRVLCPAIRSSEGQVVLCVSYSDTFVRKAQYDQMHRVPPVTWFEGFISNKGDFLTPVAAWRIADTHGQIVFRGADFEKRLLPENLYPI